MVSGWVVVRLPWRWPWSLKSSELRILFLCFRNIADHYYAAVDCVSPIPQNALFLRCYCWLDDDGQWLVRAIVGMPDSAVRPIGKSRKLPWTRFFLIIHTSFFKHVFSVRIFSIEFCSEERTLKISISKKLWNLLYNLNATLRFSRNRREEFEFRYVTKRMGEESK